MELKEKTCINCIYFNPKSDNCESYLQIVDPTSFSCKEFEIK